MADEILGFNYGVGKRHYSKSLRELLKRLYLDEDSAQGVYDEMQRLYGVSLSTSTIRRILIEEGVWRFQKKVFHTEQKERKFFKKKHALSRGHRGRYTRGGKDDGN